nr:hypothetical protein NCPCFENI_00398 [Cupriavidus sp.]
MNRKGWLPGLAALVILNGLLSFTAWWPTPAVLPDLRIAPEFVLLWLAILLNARLHGSLARPVLWTLTLIYTVFVFARYLDVTAPALFGRSVSLYWDIPQIPRFLWVSASEGPWWLGPLTIAGLVIGISILMGLIYWSIRMATSSLAIPLCKRAWLWIVTALAAILISANYAGVQATWPYVSKPVIPTYYQQLKILWDAQSPKSLARLLPDETPIESALRHPPDTVLGQLKQRDLSIIFLESFGAMLYDDPQAFEATAAARGALHQAINASGRSVVTAFYRSPTIGGASDLAHMSVLSGVDLSDPRRHDLLLTTGRPTLIQLFQTKGYEAFGLYHAVSWPWPERVFYRFDHYLDGPSLGYQGPPLGFWSIPDQFAIARFMDLHPIRPETPPRLVLFPTITSHFPFSPVPPYQPDWRQVLTEKPFGDNETEIALAERPNWRNMRPDYLRMVNYVYQWLSGFFLLPESRDTVYLLIGDHQPTANVSGEGVTWDVPVHIISRDPSLLQPLISAGFSEGLNANRAVQGGLHELPALLLQVWSTPAPGRP